MKVVILRSSKTHPRNAAAGDYVQSFDTRYAERFIGNLVNSPDFCTSCGPDCIMCRKPYGRSFAEDIAGVLDFPATLPHVLEQPEDFVPPDVPKHDILIAIAVHEQILLAMLRKCDRWGTKGVVIPSESPGWISGAATAAARRICEGKGIEVAFPKPFCSFKPEDGSILADFRRRFHIGCPDVKLEIEGGEIRRAEVRVSAPCGATYYIARWLAGRRLTDDLEFEVISKRLHSYPCTAGMEWDKELGETHLHISGEAHKKILAPLKAMSEEPEDSVLSPLGGRLPRPVPVQENMENIRNAENVLMTELDKRGALELRELREIKELSPAALSSAIIILKGEGRIKVENGSISKA